MIVSPEVLPVECGSDCSLDRNGGELQDVHESGLPPDVGSVARQWSRSFARIYIASLVLRPLRKPDCDSGRKSVVSLNR